MKKYITMKLKTIINSNILLLLAIVLIFSSCERDLSEDATLATFPKNGEVYLDGFSAGLEYLPFAGSYFEAFSVDAETKYNGTSAMRFDVPNVGDPKGAYAGAIFPDYGKRDLSDFDALTFWAKATKKGTINEIGFGQDFQENKFQVSLSNLELTTNWRQYTIAIPDPSKLTQESGLFWYAEGPENDEGYSFWIDELQFEKLGTIAQPRPSIFNAIETSITTFVGVTSTVSNLQLTLNLENGEDQTITITPAYFEFTSSDPSVATVNELGVITAVGMGEATITATLGGVQAVGSGKISVVGDFNTAPVPTRDPSDVISIFSDAYTNEPVDYYNGYWAPYQTTLGQDDININGDNIIAYTELNFVGIQFLENVSTINGSSMTHLHVDVQPREDVESGDFLTISVADVGPDNQFGTSDDSAGEITLDNSNLVNDEWYSLDISLSDLSGLTGRSNLAQVVFVSDATISSIYVDNVYFYDDGGSTSTEPTIAAPAPTEAEADVISVYSDTYSNISGSNLNHDWGQATVVTEVQVAGNNTLRYAGLDYQGLELGSSQDVSNMEFLHIDYWTANSSAFNAYLISGNSTEEDVSLSVPSSGWSSVDIPLGDFSPVDLADVIQLKFDGNGDIYLDNIYFFKESGGGDEPTAAAPTPTQDAADVISLFSNSYSNVSVNTWKTDWSMANLEDIQVAGNDTKKYTDLDFVGIETVGGNLIDASSMTHFSVDVWTPNMTTFRIKLVDFGADGEFEGGDDSEHELVFENVAQGQWVSYDISISDFTGLSGYTSMAQLIFSGLPAGGGTLYVDNVYFYNQ